MHMMRFIIPCRALATAPKFSTVKPTTSKGLYKFLLRETSKLPENKQAFYKDSVRRSYLQHSDEIFEADRLEQVIDRAIEDMRWVIEKVLSLYRRLLRLGCTWEAMEPSKTPVERQYITEETRTLFRANKRLQDAQVIKEHLREAEARMTMAEHYHNPYPRPVNLPKRSYSKREGKQLGKAVDKLHKMSKPIYIKSMEEGKHSTNT